MCASTYEYLSGVAYHKAFSGFQGPTQTTMPKRLYRLKLLVLISYAPYNCSCSAADGGRYRHVFDCVVCWSVCEQNNSISYG